MASKKTLHRQRLLAGIICLASWQAMATCPPDTFVHADDFRLGDHDTAHPNDNFGHAVATNGFFIAVGVPQYESTTSVGGAVYLFQRGSATDQWQFFKKLVAPGFAEPADLFGYAVAMDGDTLVVGASNAGDTGPNDAGAVHVFERNVLGESWGHRQTLFVQESAGFESFGSSLSLRGDHLIVGDPTSGQVVIYQRTPGGHIWYTWKTLSSPDAGNGAERFGEKVAIDGDTAVVSDPEYQMGTAPSGQVYVYGRDQGGANQWGLVRQFGGTPGQVETEFGTAISLWENRLAVSAPESAAGRVYLFERDRGGAGQWGRVIDFVAPPADTATYDQFGRTLHLHSNELLVGAPYVSGVEPSTGAAFVYQRLKGGVDQWGLEQKFYSQTNNLRSNFGAALDWSAGFAVIGDPYSDDPAFPPNAKVGHAYAFFDDSIMCSPFD